MSRTSQRLVGFQGRPFALKLERSVFLQTLLKTLNNLSTFCSVFLGVFRYDIIFVVERGGEVLQTFSVFRFQYYSESHL